MLQEVNEKSRKLERMRERLIATEYVRNERLRLLGDNHLTVRLNREDGTPAEKVELYLPPSGVLQVVHALADYYYHEVEAAKRELARALLIAKSEVLGEEPEL